MVGGRSKRRLCGLPVQTCTAGDSFHTTARCSYNFPPNFPFGGNCYSFHCVSFTTILPRGIVTLPFDLRNHLSRAECLRAPRPQGRTGLVCGTSAL